MPFVQFVSGSRDQAVEALNEAAALTIGSGSDAHIRVADPGVEASHCRVYPAEGSYWLQDLGAGQTIFKFKRLSGATAGLAPGDVFMIGGTFVKFWQEAPPGLAASAATEGPDGASAEPQEGSAEGALEGRVAELEAQLAEARAGADEGLAAAEARASEAASQLAAAEARASEVEAQLAAAEARATEAQAAIEAARAEADAARQEASAQVAAAEAAAEARSAEAEAAAEARGAAAEAAIEARVAEANEALEATRAALEGLRARVAPPEPSASPDDLEQLLAALAVPDLVRSQVDAAVARRVLEETDRAVRRRHAQVATARRLGLAGMDPAALAELLEAARSP